MGKYAGEEGGGKETVVSVFVTLLDVKTMNS